MDHVETTLNLMTEQEYGFAGSGNISTGLFYLGVDNSGVVYEQGKPDRMKGEDNAKT